MKGLFVTGTDTGVGKTVISAALMSAFDEAHYWKPVQSGSEEDDDTLTVQTLSGAASSRCWNHGIRLTLPASPHHAAEVEGRTISMDDILAHLPSGTGPWVVEGAGGLFVPISRSVLLPELIKTLDLPVLVVASTRLGTINHSLLTLHALRTLGIKVIALVLNGKRDPSAVSGIASYAESVPLIEMPETEELRPEYVHRLGHVLRQSAQITTAIIKGS